MFTFVATQPLRYLEHGGEPDERVDAATVALDIVAVPDTARSSRSTAIRSRSTKAASRSAGRRAQHRGAHVDRTGGRRAAAATAVPTVADIMRLYASAHRRRAVRLDERGDGGGEPAGRPRAGVLRRHQQSAADDAVHVAERSGEVQQLPRVLRGPRARAPVVRPGRGLEELPRAVAQRGLRAVLRGALRARAPRRAGVPRRAAASSAAGRSISRTRAPSTGLSARPHQVGRPRLPRAGLQQGRVGAAHAAAPHGRRRVLPRTAPLLRRESLQEGRHRRPAEARWSRNTSGRSTGSSSAGSSSPALPRVRYSAVAEGQELVVRFDQSARSSTSRSP